MVGDSAGEYMDEEEEISDGGKDEEIRFGEAFVASSCDINFAISAACSLI